MGPGQLQQSRRQSLRPRPRRAPRLARCFVTNCNGNFYVKQADLANITFPLLISVERTKDPGKDETTLQLRRMSSHIGREASCANCHIQGLRDFGSPGQIHLYNTETESADKSRAPKIDRGARRPMTATRSIAKCPEDNR